MGTKKALAFGSSPSLDFSILSPAIAFSTNHQPSSLTMAKTAKKRPLHSSLFHLPSIPSPSHLSPSPPPILFLTFNPSSFNYISYKYNPQSTSASLCLANLLLDLMGTPEDLPSVQWSHMMTYEERQRSRSLFLFSKEKDTGLLQLQESSITIIGLEFQRNKKY